MICGAGPHAAYFRLTQQLEKEATVMATVTEATALHRKRVGCQTADGDVVHVYLKPEVL